MNLKNRGFRGWWIGSGKRQCESEWGGLELELWQWKWKMMCGKTEEGRQSIEEDFTRTLVISKL